MVLYKFLHLNLSARNHENYWSWSAGRLPDYSINFFQNYGQFASLGIFNMQQDFSKTGWASGLKLRQLIEDDEYTQITWLTFEQSLSDFPGVMQILSF